MKILFIIIFITLSLWATGDGSMDDYQLIWQRNIFDRARGPKKVRTRKPRKTAPAIASETICLSGVVVWDGRSTAILSSSKSAFAGTYGIGDDVAGAVIKELTTSHATIMLNGTEVVWPVGNSLERQGDGPWERSEAAPPTKTKPAKPTKPPTPPMSLRATDMSREAILKRLIKRRKEESRK